MRHTCIRLQLVAIYVQKAYIITWIIIVTPPYITRYRSIAVAGPETRFFGLGGANLAAISRPTGNVYIETGVARGHAPPHTHVPREFEIIGCL